jgi:modulator of FtsH protease
MSMIEKTVLRSEPSLLATHKVLRNTYALLALTLLFSALMAGVSMAVGVPYGASMLCSLVAMGLLWFVMPRAANSGAGLWVIFLITGLLGFGLGPILSMYLKLPNGAQLVMTAMGGTGVIFLGLSGYVLTTRKNFSFIGGFLAVGMMVALVAMVANLFLHMPVFSLALSAMFMLLMSGMILYQTSEIIHGGETNYILATVTLYLAIYNLFLTLLQLLGVAGDE